MANVRVQMDISVPSSAFRMMLALALMLIGADELVSETVTLTTYYPAPSGVYVNMITTNNTWLARDSSTNSGYLNIGSNAAAGNQGTGAGNTRLIVMNGNVGIGQATPTQKLEVAGIVKLSGAGSGLMNSAGFELVETDATDWTRWNQGSGATNGNAMYQSLALGTGGLAVGEWTNQPAGVLKVVNRIGVNMAPVYPMDVNGSAHLTGGGAGMQRGYLYIDNASTGCSFAARTPNAASGCANNYVAWEMGVYVEGWTYHDRGGQVIAKNAGGANTSQVWGLNTGTGVASWHTLNKNDSAVSYYCCPK